MMLKIISVNPGKRPLDVGSFGSESNPKILELEKRKLGVGDMEGADIKVFENGLLVFQHSCDIKKRGKTGTSGYAIAYVAKSLPPNFQDPKKFLQEVEFELRNGDKVKGFLYVKSNHLARKERDMSRIRTCVKNWYPGQGKPALRKTRDIPDTFRGDRFGLMAISTKKLATWIQTKHVVFYTGAGISAANVPPLAGWYKTTGYNNANSGSENLKNLFQKICERGEDLFLDDIYDMQSPIYEAEPTTAHRKLKELVDKTHTRILTENLDQLHEKTGILALRVNRSRKYGASPKITEHLTRRPCNYDVKTVDIIVCIGLSGDHSGLLAYCKKENPNIKFVSINPSAEFNGPMHFWLEGDADDILPKLNKMVHEK